MNKDKIEFILFFSFVGLLVILIAICFIGQEILWRRYKNFYENTAEGKKLYCALYNKSILGGKRDRFVDQKQRLREQIDEYTYYRVETCANQQYLYELKVEYANCCKEIDIAEEELSEQEKTIKLIIKELPKKYKNALEYNWQEMKVKVEDGDLCW